MVISCFIIPNHSPTNHQPFPHNIRPRNIQIFHVQLLLGLGLRCRRLRLFFQCLCACLVAGFDQGLLLLPWWLRLVG